MSPFAEPALRIVFAGTPDFAVPSLRALIDGGFRPVAVLTQPDRPAGRGRKLQASPVKQLASMHRIPVLQPRSLRGAGEVARLADLEPDLAVVAAYGLILPQAVLDVPRLGCWNVHASLLPRWRGAAPIQRAIEAGDARSGACIMRMDAGLDTGPVYACDDTAIRPDDTGGSLHDRIAGLGADLLLHCLHRLLDGSLPEPRPQPADGATYASKLEKTEAALDWSQPARLLERRIRAFVPWPVAWCDLAGERLRVWRAEVPGGPCPGAPGEILGAGEAGIDIATADGVLRLTEVQRAGGRRVAAAEYLRARPLGPAE